MTTCFFVTDLHGNPDRYQKLMKLIEDEKPEAVFLGGDLLPSGFSALAYGVSIDDFIVNTLEGGFDRIKRSLAENYPSVFLILGNDDLRIYEELLRNGERMGLWEYVHNRATTFHGYSVYGYACVPPTPFLLKDWERYDVSRFVDVGCVPLEEGWRSVEVAENIIQFSTIEQDLDELTGAADLSNAIFLFHSPPYQTHLDRAGLDGKMVDHVPLDVHVGSIAIKRFIEKRQPLVTLHGHIHESSRLTGSWKDRIGRTHLFSAACEGNLLALVRFDPACLESASCQFL